MEFILTAIAFLVGVAIGGVAVLVALSGVIHRPF